MKWEKVHCEPEFANGPKVGPILILLGLVLLIVSSILFIAITWLHREKK